MSGITRQDIEKNKRKCFKCSRPFPAYSTMTDGEFVYSISFNELQADDDGIPYYISKTNWASIHFCQKCFEGIAGEEYTFEFAKGKNK